MTKIKAEDAFRTADAFAIACGVLETEAKAGRAVILSFVRATLEALTLEMYLKSLLLMENSEHRRGHDLYKLFNYLNPKTRGELSRDFDKNTARNLAFLAEAKMRKTPIDLKSLLILGRHSFSDFRYPHELKGRSQTVFGLKGLAVCIRRRITAIHPEWGEYREKF
ncbi:MAG: hypothetical protein ACR2HH_10405 [Chthoniobacterales bacterium]